MVEISSRFSQISLEILSPLADNIGMSNSNSSKVFRVVMGENGEDQLWEDRTFSDYKEAYEFARKLIDEHSWKDWEIIDPLAFNEVAAWESKCDFCFITKETA
jgi:hypothetical protein